MLQEVKVLSHKHLLLQSGHFELDGGFFTYAQLQSHTPLGNRDTRRTSMGLSNIPNISEGVLVVLVVNTKLSVVLLKNMMRFALEAVGVHDVLITVLVIIFSKHG